MSDLRYTVLPGLVAALSGSWRLIGPTNGLELSGDITVDRASLQRKDDLANIMLDWFGDEPSPPGSGGIRLDLHVEADQSIEIRNPSVRLVGSASLDISGSTEQPGLVGKMEFEEGGELTLQTVRYELEHGRLTFADPERIDPFVEIQARTRVQNYEITVRLTGTADRLIPSVSSNPPLPEEEVYSLLAMGYRSDMLGSGAMGVGFASSIISRELTSELDRRAGLVLPVDQVRVDPFTETTTGSPAARVTVVQQLSPVWTVVLQSNLSAQRQEVVVSRWYLSPGLFVEASRDIDGTYGVDLKLRKQY
jgi:translocation and assembly module TamB